MKMIKMMALAALLGSAAMANETLALNMSQMENGLSNVQ